MAAVFGWRELVVVVHEEEKDGKKVLDIGPSTLTVNTTNDKEYLNQKSWGSFEADYWEGKVSAAVQPLTVSTSNKRNVIYKWIKGGKSA